MIKTCKDPDRFFTVCSKPLGKGELQMLNKLKTMHNMINKMINEHELKDSLTEVYDGGDLCDR